MNRADLKLRTPDRWYYVQYENGREISQTGFLRKELAESFLRSCEEEAQYLIKAGAKRRPEITDAIVEAKGWRVGGKVFKDFHEALWYKWTEEPNQTINGFFDESI